MSFTFLSWANDFVKARGHKYIKRVPSGTTKTGRIKYRYIYKVGHRHKGRHVDHHDDMVVNAKFMIHSKSGEEVHLHIKGVKKNGDLVVVYDDGPNKGKEKTMSKDELSGLLDKEHDVKRTLEERAKKKASPKKVENALNTLLKALQTNPDLLQDPRLKSLLGSVSVDEKSLKSNQAELYIKDAKGLKKVNAQYKIMEADDLIPSHNPHTFGKHEKYPKGVQERDYTGDFAEQEKVTMNAQGFIPALAVNTNPDATNGAPIVTPEGVVLGGNSRTMSMQLVYSKHPDRAKELRAYVKEHAENFGIPRSEAEKFKNPVLIRVHEPEQDNKAHLQMLVRQLNVTLTQEMDTRTKGRAVAVLLSDETLKHIADGMNMTDNRDKSLTEFLRTPSDKLDLIVANLRRDTIITSQNQTNWVEGTAGGKKVLTSSAVKELGNVFLGKVIQDLTVLNSLPSSLANNLHSALPLLIGKGVPKEMLGKLETAVSILSSAMNTGKVDAGGSRKRAVESFQANYLDQVEMDPEVDKFKDPARKDPIIGNFISLLILANGPRKLKTAFKEIGKAYSPEAEAMESLFAEPPKTPESALLSEIERHAKKEGLKDFTFKGAYVFTRWSDYFMKKMEL